MKNLYYFKITLARFSSNIFRYPCESQSNFSLKNRYIYIYGGKTNWKKDLEEKFSNLFPESILTENLKECTDLIVLPSDFNPNINNSEQYFNEIYYYHDISMKCILDNESKLKNIIYLLPQNSDEYSTNYKNIADYATMCFTKGLSKNYANKGKYFYTLLVNENSDINNFWGTLIYCLSNNSNHIIGTSFKLK